MLGAAFVGCEKESNQKSITIEKMKQLKKMLLIMKLTLLML